MMPVFSSVEEERKYRKEHLALAFRIFHRFKMAEGIAGEFGILCYILCTSLSPLPNQALGS